MTRVLQGIRIVEQGSFITGPCAAMMLADLGAEVIKVEPPEGDPYRQLEGRFYSPHFQAYNRNKQSLCLDLKRDDDREVLYSLIEQADVYIHNFRPGAVDRLGASEADLRARNPRLIYCAISGFGDSGPYVSRPSYDTTAQALSGFLSVMTDAGQPRLSGPALADPITGLYAALGIMGALVERSRTNQGRRVEISMLEAMAHFAIEPFTSYFCLERTPGPLDRPRLSQSCILRAGDGLLLAIHLSSPEKFWSNLLTAVGSDALAADDRFATRSGRIQHYEALVDELNRLFAARPREEWLALLAANDVPHAPVNTVPEAAEDPQVRHLDLLVDVVHPTEGRTRTVRPAIRYDGIRTSTVTAAPTIGEHSAEIRQGLLAESRTHGAGGVLSDALPAVSAGKER